VHLSSTALDALYALHFFSEVLFATRYDLQRTSLTYFSIHIVETLLDLSIRISRSQHSLFLTSCFILTHRTQVPHTKCCDKGSNEPVCLRVFAWDRTCRLQSNFHLHVSYLSRCVS